MHIDVSFCIFCVQKRCFFLPDFCVFHLKVFSGSLHVTSKVFKDKLRHYATMPSSRISKTTRTRIRESYQGGFLLVMVNHAETQALSEKNVPKNQQMIWPATMPCLQTVLQTATRKQRRSTPHHPTIITMMFQSMMLCPLLRSFRKSPEPWANLATVITFWGHAKGKTGFASSSHQHRRRNSAKALITAKDIHHGIGQRTCIRCTKDGVVWERSTCPELA